MNITLHNKSLKYNCSPKLLGVTLDEKLTFNQHILNIEKRAGKSLGMLREIKGIGNIKTKFLLQIYNSIVGSILQYASCVWNTGNREHLDRLNWIQRKGLAIVLGLPSTASLEVLEVMSGTLPLDLRREEICIRDIAKINSYSTKLPIKNKLEEWRSVETPDKHTTPLGLMSCLAEDMKKELDIDIKNIEPELEYHGLQAIKSPPEYWRNLGSSKNRTKEQIETGNQIITTKILETSEYTAIAFTDGSCLSNPGPCGAGALVLLNGIESELKQPVCKRGSILLAELIAIKLVLDFIYNPDNRRKVNQIKIFSDSQSAIGILSLNWKIENHKLTARTIISKMKALQQEGIEVIYEWTPGHANVRGNEIADKLAKEAAKEAENMSNDSHNTITKQDVKKAARDYVINKWQSRWDVSERGRFYFNHHKYVKDRPILDFPDRQTSIIVNNLRSGFAKLNDYAHKIGIIDSPLCSCGERETVEHFMLNCNLYEEQRQKLIHEMYYNTGSLNLDLETLLSVGKETSVLPETEKLRILAQYISDTNRF